MGCDGGTIPRRDELVRLKKKPEQKDKNADREFRWLHCALTQERLQEPIVMCGLGRLYSKQNVIEQLLEKEKMPESTKHIKSLKDIKTLKLTPNPSFTDEDKTEGFLDTRHAPYICKLIGLEMSGKFNFIGLWTCGCVMSERALKQIKSTERICPLCQTPFSVEDVIQLNATSDEELEMLQAKIEMRSAKKKASKKEKSKEKKASALASTETTTTTIAATESNDGPSTSKAATIENEKKKVETVNEVKVEKPQKAGSKLKYVADVKRIGMANDPLEDPDIKRLRTDYSVAKDPKASDVYKSLFTSHKNEKDQNRAHWITYNPFYN